MIKSLVNGFFFNINFAFYLNCIDAMQFFFIVDAYQKTMVRSGCLINKISHWAFGRNTKAQKLFWVCEKLTGKLGMKLFMRNVLPRMRPWLIKIIVNYFICINNSCIQKKMPQRLPGLEVSTLSVVIGSKLVS